MMRGANALRKRRAYPTTDGGVPVDPNAGFFNNFFVAEFYTADYLSV